MPFKPELLTSERERAGLSKPQLAKKSGVPMTTVYELEAGGYKDPGTKNLEKMAAVLGVDWRVFFVDELQENVNVATPKAG